MDYISLKNDSRQAGMTKNLYYPSLLSFRLVRNPSSMPPVTEWLRIGILYTRPLEFQSESAREILESCKLGYAGKEL